MRGLWLIETGCSLGRLDGEIGIFILFTVLCKRKSTNLLPGSPLFAYYSKNLILEPHDGGISIYGDAHISGLKLGLSNGSKPREHALHCMPQYLPAVTETSNAGSHLANNLSCLSAGKFPSPVFVLVIEYYCGGRSD